MRLALCLILLASVCSAQVSRRVQGDGLIFQLTFENGGGVNDAGPINGSLQGTISQPERGPLRRSLYTSATGSGFQIPASVTVQATNAGTVAAWVYLDRETNGNRWVWFYVSGNTSRKYIYAANNVWAFSHGNPATTITGPPARIGQWEHVAIAWSGGAGGTFSAYVNGLHIATSNYTDTAGTVSLSTAMYQSTDNPPFFGSVDNWSMWTRRLSRQEIAALANSRRRNHSQ